MRPADARIEGDDDLGRERLARYGARPPFALERFGRRADGSITYRIKKLAHGAREKVRVMTPLEFLARLATLIPPPTIPVGSLPRGLGARLQVAARRCAQAA
jgi:hypothetical protein